MQGLLSVTRQNPWTAMETLLDGPLHPGGTEATQDLLDRAAVGPDSRLLELGCGDGTALQLARDRGATTVGLDKRPDHAGSIGGAMSQLPIQAASVDVVLAECTLCLSENYQQTLSEINRVLTPDGRLTLSDVVVDIDLSSMPSLIAEPFCLQQAKSQSETLAAIKAAGFTIEQTTDHQQDLIAMRDELTAQVDYEALLAMLGSQGEQLLGTINELEVAVERGDIGYLSVIATHTNP